MKEVSEARLVEICIAAAQAAGGHALKNHARRTEADHRSAHDVKLRLDVESQAAAEAVVRTAFPDHALIGEESGLREQGTGYVWVIDPIDGTVNFSHGLPYWCSSVAVQFAGRTVAGSVVLPMLGEVYAATASGPAMLNGATIRVSDVGTLRESIVYSGMVEKDGDDGVSMRMMDVVAPAVQKIRILGSAAAELCYVAAGRGEGYAEMTIHLWDLAAGALLVERAGGRAEKLEDLGHYKMRFMADNGRIHDELRGLLRSAIAGGGRPGQGTRST